MKRQTEMSRESRTLPRSRPALRLSLPMLTLILTLAANFAARADDYRPVADRAAFEQLYRQKMSEVKTLEADFVQEKEITLLTRKLVTEGQMKYGGDKRLRIEYFEPNPFVFSMLGNRTTIKDGGARRTVSGKGRGAALQIARLTAASVNGTIFDMDDFAVAVSENADSYLVALAPKSKTLKEYYSEILIRLSKAAFRTEELRLIEVSGDKTIMRFKNIRTNNELPDKAFLVD
ncbi:MAG: outer membrane lipoprotein carrier protein LolA [Prevotellaceae bacterium]|jgi:outer membrane lipoprotein-sorting protein|nr:outer membrane lipoprotein carrier protein LolA [Prevotellaceae bacterium]